MLYVSVIFTLALTLATGLFAQEGSRPPDVAAAAKAAAPKPLTAEQRLPPLEIAVQLAQLETQYLQAQAALQKLAEQHAALSRERGALLEKIGRENGAKGWVLDSKLQWVPALPAKPE